MRQALVSLSSMHLDYATSIGQDSVGIERNILVQHGKALRALRRRVQMGGSDAIKAALICCVLFHCFEIAIGNSDTAMQHLQNGINILSAWQKTGRNYAEDQAMSAVSAVLERLDLQATMFDNSRTSVLTAKPDKSAQESGFFCELSMIPFAKLEDARDDLTRLQSWLFQFLNQNLQFKESQAVAIPLSVKMEKKHLLESFSTWHERFEPFAKQSVCRQTACGCKILLIHWQISRMLLLSDYPPNDFVFGACPNPESERIINLASDILEATEERNASAGAAKDPRRNLSLEVGIVAPLFVLAMKCSDESIRGRAMNLLSMSQRREGLFDSQMMASMVRQFQEAQMRRSLEGTLQEDAGERQSLEAAFAEEIDKVTGYMDKIADFI